MFWKERSTDKAQEAQLFKDGKHPLIARLVAKRDISDVNSFLSASYKNLSHPHSLNDVEKAAKIFCDIALKHESVGVMGDFDCDGIISSVMIKQLCTIFGLQCTVFLPSRLDHGYGLTQDAIATFKERVKGKIPKLLFVLDCGSSNEQEMVILRKMGIEKIIIIDHHIINNANMSKSADAIISWHLSDCHEMCTCGEVFQFIRGIRWLTKKIDPIEFLTYAAIGTVADVSPIVGDNRIIVRNGLSPRAIENVTSVGFNSLLRASGIYSSSVTQQDVAFQIAPKINAAGRLETPDTAYRLMIEPDVATAEKMAQSLVDCNNKRKTLQKKIEKEAVNMVRQNEDHYKHGIVVLNYKWHIGVVGIVASKLVETFYRPVLVIGENNGVYKGSGRSLPHINIKKILDDCQEMFVKYGGHATAAGVTLKNDYVETANKLFNKACEKYYQDETLSGPEEIDYYDATLKTKALSTSVAVILRDSMYPYCNNYNPEPIFCLRNAILTKPEIGGNKIWRILNFSATKDGIESEMRFKMFTSEIGTEVSGKKADIYFKFPQQVEPGKYGDPTLDVIDIIFEK